MKSDTEQNNAMASTSTGSDCPVMIRRDESTPEETEISTNISGGLWSRFFARPSPTSSAIPSSESASRCPVKGDKSIPASIEEDARHSQFPAPGQRIPLSTQRVISSIPRGDTTDSATEASSSSPPAHQPTNSFLWMYPSEQQFYNAMLKKGYRPPVESIPSVLQIHNAVNERSWLQVCKWEKDLHGNEDPKLVKFVGRPKDLSPKAWFNSRILMTQEPFDRHDWYVEDTKGGEPRRYVIDFYEGKEKIGDRILGDVLKDGGQPRPASRPPSMFIDVRPALDTPSAAVDRMTMFLRETLPGIASAYDTAKLSRKDYQETVGTVKKPSQRTDQQ